jgi:hypothetical protein
MAAEGCCATGRPIEIFQVLFMLLPCSQSAPLRPNRLIQ